MANNSDKRKKAFLISVLAFLFAGGGVFLFFIVQGSNDLTGKGKNKNFSYGTVAREGVSSFFKSVGIFPQEDEALSDSAVARLESRGLPLEGLGVTPPSGDISDWMAKDSSRSAAAPKGGSASPTKVPKMAMKAASGVGGGGGGSKSAGSVSRFGAGSESGETSVSSKAGDGKSGSPDKATLASLKNARAMLGQGVRSGSAQTARDKWGQSFGVGGKGASGNLAYNKGGMVSLDKIKSGEIASLKMDQSKSLTTPDVTSPLKDKDGTKSALSQDADVKKKLEAEMKKKMAQELISSAGKAMEDGMKEGQANASPTAPSVGEDGKPADMPDEVWSTINDTTCGSNDGCTTGNGAEYTDTQRTIDKNSDGTWTCAFSGTQTNPDGTVITYTDTVTYGKDGIPIDLAVVEKPS